MPKSPVASAKKRRRFVLTVGLMLIPFALTGCFKFTIDLEVSNQDTVSGTSVVALSEALAALAQEGGGGEPTDAFGEIDGVTVSEFDDGNFVGQQYDFSGVPIESFALNDDASALSIERDGDNLVLRGNLSLEDEGADPAAGEDLGFGQEFFDSADLRVSIKFPGEILETNGKIDESTNTITWVPKFGEANELSATVYAPKGIPIWVWWAVAAGVALVLAIVGFVLVVRVRGRKSSLEPGIGTESAVLTPSSESNFGGFSRGDRPVFSYRVRSSPFAKERFELRMYDEEVSYGFFDNAGNPTTDAATIKIDAIEHSSVLEGRAGIGARIVHSGRVELLPAKIEDAKTLVALIDSLQQGTKNPASVNPPSLPPSPSEVSTSGEEAKSVVAIAGDMREYYQLLQDGVISQDEFDEMKRRRIEKG